MKFQDMGHFKPLVSYKRTEYCEVVCWCHCQSEGSGVLEFLCFRIFKQRLYLLVLYFFTLADGASSILSMKAHIVRSAFEHQFRHCLSVALLLDDTRKCKVLHIEPWLRSVHGVSFRIG